MKLLTIVLSLMVLSACNPLKRSQVVMTKKQEVAQISAEEAARNAVISQEELLSSELGITYFWGCMTGAKYSLSQEITAENQGLVISELSKLMGLLEKAVNTSSDENSKSELEEKIVALTKLLNEEFNVY